MWVGLTRPVEGLNRIKRADLVPNKRNSSCLTGFKVGYWFYPALRPELKNQPFSVLKPVGLQTGAFLGSTLLTANLDTY